MHLAPYLYVKQRSERYMPSSVLDLGGRNINGTVREHFATDDYVAVDICDGDGIDIVADCTLWRPERTFDMVLCLEVFEHVRLWPLLVRTAFDSLGDNGYFVCTCATDPRPPHSGSGERRLPPGEWYGNVKPNHLAEEINILFEAWEMQVDARHGDLFVTAVKGPGDL